MKSPAWAWPPFPEAEALAPLRLLRGKRVVLASGSPRRRDILLRAGVRFDVVPAHFREDLAKASFPAPPAYAVETARRKALEVAARLRADPRPPEVVIGADTVVILEKPRDAADALRMLRSLSGRQHSVITGVAVVRPTGAGNPGTERPEAEANPEAEAEVNPDAEVNREVHPEVDAEVTLFHEEARVTFLPLSEAQLRDYVATGEPLDKAGAYGLQGGAAAFAERVEGDALAAVGFPLRRFCRELAAIFPEATAPPPQ